MTSSTHSQELGINSTGSCALSQSGAATSTALGDPLFGGFTTRTNLVEVIMPPAATTTITEATDVAAPIITPAAAEP